MCVCFLPYQNVDVLFVSNFILIFSDSSSFTCFIYWKFKSTSKVKVFDTSQVVNCFKVESDSLISEWKQD